MTDDHDSMHPATEPRANFILLEGGREPPETGGETDIVVASSETVGVRLQIRRPPTGNHPQGRRMAAALTIGLHGGADDVHYVCVSDRMLDDAMTTRPLGLRLEAYGNAAIDDLIATLIALGERLKPVATRRRRPSG